MLILSTFIQVNDLEFAQVESQVVQGLKVGNESLKKLHQVSVQSKRGSPFSSYYGNTAVLRGHSHKRPLLLLDLTSDALSTFSLQKWWSYKRRTIVFTMQRANDINRVLNRSIGS
jgi:hypothetical protein